MYNIKTLLAAAAATVAMAAGVSGAQAAPWEQRDHRPIVRHEVVRHEAVRHDFGRPLVVRERVLDTLRFHHYRGIGAPYFLRGHYVVRSHDRFGHIVFVEVDPHTGAFIGELRA